MEELGLSDGEIENAKQVVINVYLENFQKENMCRWWLNWIAYADQSQVKTCLNILSRNTDH